MCLDIPSTLSNCEVLQYLSMDNNFFEGAIPPSLCNIKGLITLDLSCNNLSGPIPEMLESSYYLEYLNLSFNNLSGEVPMKGVFANTSAVSLLGNTGLCEGVLTLSACPMNVRIFHKEETNWTG